MNTHSQKIAELEVGAYRVPTDQPESDGTLEWDHTGVVVVRLRAGPARGLGWTYAPRAAATLIHDVLASAVLGADPFSTAGLWQTLHQRLRNAGARSLGAMALSAVDIALWDLHARLAGQSLVHLWGSCRPAVSIYGSGGFTSYSDRQLAGQLSGWVEDGITQVKMKVGREPDRDVHRVKVARRAVGKAGLKVDANGAYTISQAAAIAQRYAELGVDWFEEPVTADDLAGLRRVRANRPAGMEIAAGEYGDTPDYFLRLLQAETVDCLQADVTRCGGFTGFFRAAALAEAFHLPLSAHCAPQLHAHLGCAVPGMRDLEYFHDHVRIEHRLFDGCIPAKKGTMQPDPDAPGHGLTFKEAAAALYTV